MAFPDMITRIERHIEDFNKIYQGCWLTLESHVGHYSYVITLHHWTKLRVSHELRSSFDEKTYLDAVEDLHNRMRNTLMLDKKPTNVTIHYYERDKENGGFKFREEIPQVIKTESILKDDEVDNLGVF